MSTSEDAICIRNIEKKFWGKGTAPECIRTFHFIWKIETLSGDPTFNERGNPSSTTPLSAYGASTLAFLALNSWPPFQKF